MNARISDRDEPSSRQSPSDEIAPLAEPPFRLLVESLPQLVWMADASGACNYLGPQWLAYTGLPTTDSLGTAWIRSLHPDDRQVVGAQWFETVQSQARGVFDGEFRVRRHDGVYRWFKTRAVPYRDASDRFIGWFGTCTDIQDMKEATAALQEERDRINLIATVAPSILHSFRRDRAGTITFPFGGERVAALYGLPLDRITIDATAIAGLVHPDDAGIWAKIEESGSTLCAFIAEFRVRRPDGREIWVEVNSLPVAEPDGAMAWHGTITDITARKNEEQAVARNQAQFEAVFQNLAEGIVVVSPEGMLTHSNPAAAVLHDLQAPNGPSNLREFIPQFEVRDPAGQLIAPQNWPLSRILRGEVLRHHECSVHHKALGWTKVMNYAGSLVRDAQGQPMFAVVHLRDITEMRRAEAELRALNLELDERVKARTAELQDAVNELEAFSYSVSHDLRAPLRALDGFSQALLQDHAANLPEAGQRYLRIIRESAQKMAQLIDDLLAFSRVGRQSPKLRLVDHGLLARNALQQLAPMREGRTVEVRMGTLLPSMGDPAMLHQVWINLLSNALKYTRKNDAALIHIESYAEADGPVYVVRDNGAGFDMRYVHKLFGVFERLHRADEFEGTGVGLAIVQRIVQRHHGSVRAEGEPGRGARFSFQLPPGPQS